MRLKLNKIKLWLVSIGSIFTLIMGPLASGVYADERGITMSPMNQRVVLNAGEKYTGSFTISNPVNNSEDIKYQIAVQPFYVDDDYNVYFEETEGLNQIVDWTTVDIDSGLLPVGQVQKIHFTIDVPKDAPAGGQYAAITAVAVDEKNTKDDVENVGATISQNMSIAHIIYAEIAGTTRRSGEVINTNVPSFLLDGNISAESTIKNTGNTHGTATYKLQIFPLFSNEEVYTNEEVPQTKTILPNRTLTNKTIWDQTPAMGIFNVKYTVEFEGVTTEVTKLVIKCPLWLLFVILFVIIALIIWIVIRIRAHKKSGKRAEVEA